MKMKITYNSFMQSVTDRSDFNPDFQMGFDQGWIKGANHADARNDELNNWKREHNMVTCAYVLFMVVVFGAVALALFG